MDLLFPRRCPICDEPVNPFGALICDSCRSVPMPIQAPTCRCCGKEVPPWQEVCSDCARRPHPYEQGYAVWHYRGVSGSLYRFKYRGRAEYADYYGRVMAARVRECCDRSCFDLIVPVPVSPERLRRRGYNQAGRMAQVIGRELGVPVAQNALRRREETATMRGLDAGRRRENLEKAFIGIQNDVLSKKVMLVDDIYTTGATIDACTTALLHAGAMSVRFVVLAIGEDPAADGRRDGRDG